ncbi:S-layer-like domain-containing protein [Sporomusaceae bacterium FL31]|nr:S-layer-like domain-containing protein [Sporomusaceae bacterium FL31]GCE32264.1 S-layer-like domain-containing protein [Sporomusaceae bacterium]
MNRKIISTLVSALIIGAAIPGFAAASPFEDVPAKHWAYDAVAKLAQAGIIDGYGDGTYRGDKTLTRYELAQIVANALTKANKANQENQVVIKQLSAEFADELNGLGVRVTKLESKSKVDFNADFSTRYTAKDDEADSDKTSSGQYRLRLDAKANVDEKSTLNLRFVTVNPYQSTKGTAGLLRNNTWNTAGANSTTASNSAGIDRVWLASKLGAVNANIGRQPLVVGISSGIVDAGAFSFDGVKFGGKIGSVDTAVNWGRLVDQKDIASVELKTESGKLKYGVGYFSLQDHAGAVTPYTVDVNGAVTSFGKDIAQLYFGNFIYNFTPKVSLSGEFSKNNADYATDKNISWTTYAVLGDQALVKKGQHNVKLQYTSVGKNALALDNQQQGLPGTAAASTGLTTFDTTFTQDKYSVLGLSYRYAFSKNLVGETYYVSVDDKASSINDYDYLRAVLIAKF